MNQSSPKELEVIVLAAGKGTRMNSCLPKVLHRLCGRTLLERTIRSIEKLSKRTVVVVGFASEKVILEMQRLQREVPELSELIPAFQNEQKGTGHAAMIGLEAVSPAADYVLILPGDIPLISTSVLESFISSSRQSGASVSVLSCVLENPYGFGRIVRNANGECLGIVEQRDCTPEQAEIAEINSSIYLVKRAFLATALKTLRPENNQGELYLTDIVEQAVLQGVASHVFCTENFMSVTGANSRSELSQLEKYRRKELVEVMMDRGVSFENPDSTYIEEEVEIGKDTFVGANTRLLGRVRIGDNVTIEGDCLIADSEVLTGTLVKLGCYIRDSVVGNNCEIGPFAQLRPETSVGSNSKIGNFVELKKAKLGDSVKANHLSYIGDAEVGSQSNIGAGTIFCNYDGVKKSKTVLGESVFVGSNSVLVAPISIGANSYVGAGSAVTKDVPEGSLAIARGKQSNIEGWVERRNKKQITEKA